LPVRLIKAVRHCPLLPVRLIKAVRHCPLLPVRLTELEQFLTVLKFCVVAQNYEEWGVGRHVVW